MENRSRSREYVVAAHPADDDAVATVGSQKEKSKRDVKWGVQRCCRWVPLLSLLFGTRKGVEPSFADIDKACQLLAMLSAFVMGSAAGPVSADYTQLPRGQFISGQIYTAFELSGLLLCLSITIYLYFVFAFIDEDQGNASDDDMRRNSIQQSVTKWWYSGGRWLMFGLMFLLVTCVWCIVTAMTVIQEDLWYVANTNATVLASQFPKKICEINGFNACFEYGSMLHWTTIVFLMAESMTLVHLSFIAAGII